MVDLNNPLDQVDFLKKFVAEAAKQGFHFCLKYMDKGDGVSYSPSVPRLSSFIKKFVETEHNRGLIDPRLASARSYIDLAEQRARDTNQSQAMWIAQALGHVVDYLVEKDDDA